MRELENVIERLVVTIQIVRRLSSKICPSEIRVQDQIVALRPKRERRRTVADDLVQAHHRPEGVVLDHACIRCSWIVKSRASNVREIVRRGLEEARGNYKIVARLFNMEPHDYKRFLNFLRKHDCQIPFKEYR